MKLVGIINMKDNKGKILFVEEEIQGDNGVGKSTDKVFCFDKTALDIDECCLGCDIRVNYRCGYNGKAYVDSVEVL